MRIVVGIKRFLHVYQILDVKPPIAIGISLLGVKGHFVGIEDSAYSVNAHPITHADLVFPEVIVRQLDEDPVTTPGAPACADYQDKRRLTIAIAAWE